MKLSTGIAALASFTILGGTNAQQERHDPIEDLRKETPKSELLYQQQSTQSYLPPSRDEPYRQTGKAKNNFDSDSRDVGFDAADTAYQTEAAAVQKKPKSSSKRLHSRSSKSSKGAKSSKLSKAGAGSPPTTTPPPTSSPNPLPGCTSTTAASLRAQVPEVTTQNPERCCTYNGPVGVILTHAEAFDGTSTGFEQYWDTYYGYIDRVAEDLDICFVFTGVETTSRSLSDVLSDANKAASAISEVQAIMTTDPTSDLGLVTTIRGISQDLLGPNIGIFNAGSNNVIIEAIISGFERLPYVGYTDDSAYGRQAASLTLDLLDGAVPSPLCLNGRPDLDFVGQRCEAYYDNLGASAISPPTGFPCNSSSTAQEFLPFILQEGVNAMLAHVDCCSAAVEAAELVNSTTIVGCTDEDTTGGRIDFITRQPIQLQAYSTVTWIANPVLQAQSGNAGRSDEFFPGLQSFVNTAIFNQILF